MYTVYQIDGSTFLLQSNPNALPHEKILSLPKFVLVTTILSYFLSNSFFAYNIELGNFTFSAYLKFVWPIRKTNWRRLPQAYLLSHWIIFFMLP